MATQRKKLFIKQDDNTSIVDILKDRARSDPSAIIYEFLNYEKEPVSTHSLSAKTLDLKATSIANILKNKVNKEEPVLLLFEPGPDYIAALFGCLYANVIAVPAYPPLNKDMATHLSHIMTNANIRMVLSDNKIISRLKSLKLISSIYKYVKPLLPSALKKQDKVLQAIVSLNKVEIININKIKLNDKLDTSAAEIDLDSIAYLQYTSGSTSTPKGVIITHKTLCANLKQISNHYQLNSNDIIVNWLPPYHDMGLISGIFIPVYKGFKAIHISPFDFLKKPIRWLEAINNYRATLSGGPDFAFRLCAKKLKPEDIKTLNLSSWRIAFCGSEKVHADTFELFYQLTKNTGLIKGIFSPCYGLAEAILFVSGTFKLKKLIKLFDKEALKHGHGLPSHPKHEHAQAIVSAGYIADECHIKIVNPHTLKALADGQIGEIWIHGPNIAKGYWQNQKASAATMQANIRNQLSVDYLRTGDLGFIFNNELFITGRIKDLIIIAGKNHYPHDIEQSIEEEHLEGIRHGCIAAFSIEKDSKEVLILVVEVKHMLNLKDQIAALSNCIRGCIAKKHHISVEDILFVPPKSIPKTTSGKLRRNECKRLYLENQLTNLGA